MRHILLLGAGFSRNWGGPLASEVFEHLLAIPEIQQDPYLGHLLWETSKPKGGGFEQALDKAKQDASSDVEKVPSLEALRNGVSAVFDVMNRGFFELLAIEPEVRTFLSKFDAIYSLDQDVLLEHHYLKHLDLIDPDRWTGAQIPGMRRIPSNDTHPSWGKDTWVPNDDPSEFVVSDRLQPLFKPHGSSNWVDEEGGEMLIVGGNKAGAIKEHPVLDWYFRKFEEDITSEARLFVIGYSFGDNHINEQIIKGVGDGLRFFVLDPLGSEVARQANPSYGAMVMDKSAEEMAFEEGLIGASRRNLRDIFGGNDPISHANIMSFFK